MARVSVIVATHNKRDLLLEALESVFHQSYRDFDVIVVDDGSTDGTPVQVFSRFGAQPEAIAALARMNPTSIRPFSHSFVHHGLPVHYHYYGNRGLSSARNRGIRVARSPLLAFLDHEDAWSPDHLALSAEVHEDDAHPVISYVNECSPKERARARAARRDEPLSGMIFEHVLDASQICISSSMINRVCFNECGFFDENLPACADYDLWLRLCSRYPVVHVPGPQLTRRSVRHRSSSRAWTWDRYRVYALEKAFQSGHLDPGQRLLVAEEIVRKCERLVDGFTKQTSDERANFYERKRKRFALEVRKLRASEGLAHAQARLTATPSGAVAAG